jgi:hypothetical protein
MPYDICIDEEQRLIILKALQLLKDTTNEESDLLIELFTDLPTLQKDNPNTTLGFCY